MAKYVVNINADDCTVEVKADERLVKTEEELDEIVSKINKKEIKAEVYYDGEKTQLYQMQGGIGAKGFGFIAPLLLNPAANLFLALTNYWFVRGGRKLRPLNIYSLILHYSILLGNKNILKACIM